MAYELFYWPGIQGRGEFVRLALEEAGADYVDVAREDLGAVSEVLEKSTTPSFAPPFLRDGEVLVGQTAAVLFYLGPRLGLAPGDEAGRLWTHQIELTVADLVDEAHDVHHPVGAWFYYEDQKPEALRRAEGFRDERIPKFLRWFETVLERNPAGPEHMVGETVTYADLCVFQALEGLTYAFPKAMARHMPRFTSLSALQAVVRERPRLAAYLESDRRIPFNEDGIFRHYPELDA